MPTSSRQILRTFVTLTFLSTFATSIIWGVNTLFLLSAGLSVAQAFAANAFFTLGQVLFEVPTGIIADTTGRRRSYLYGSITLFISTLLYLLFWQVQASFWLWAIGSMILGLGFTFFSGAVEAWLVDALKATGYTDTLERAFAKGQVAMGVAMLGGTLSGGLIAQFTNLGVPYMVRAAILVITLIVAFITMHDVGFTPRRGESIAKETKSILKASIKQGLGNRPVRWMMLAAPFSAGVSYYGFYAIQPYLLEITGKPGLYSIAGLAAAIVALGLIVGGYLVPLIHKFFKRRTSVLFFISCFSVGALALIGLVPNFWFILSLLAFWGMLYAAATPIRQSYINELIQSDQRATVLSSDNLITSLGAASIQPGLGRVADMHSFGASYLVGSVIHILALPFIVMARREQASSDPIITKVKSSIEHLTPKIPPQPIDKR